MGSNLLHKLQLNQAKKRLQRKHKRLRRSPSFQNLQKAVKVGILYSLTDEKSFTAVNSFIAELQKEHKSLQVIGLCTTKATPAFYKINALHKILLPKDMNLFLQPKAAFIADFIQAPFDILLNLDLESHFALHYLAAICNAKMKVGIPSDFSAYYDVLLKTDEEETQNAKAQIAMIKNYLSTIF